MFTLPACRVPIGPPGTCSSHHFGDGGWGANGIASERWAHGRKQQEPQNGPRSQLGRPQQMLSLEEVSAFVASFPYALLFQ